MRHLDENEKIHMAERRVCIKMGQESETCPQHATFDYECTQGFAARTTETRYSTRSQCSG